MADFVSYGRKGDCVLQIEQDSEKRCMTIVDMNRGVEDLLGYSRNELIGQDLQLIFSNKDADILSSYLSYDELNFDIVMSRLKNFAMRARRGEDVHVTKKVFIIKSTDSKILYEMLVRKVGFIEQFEKYCYSFENYKPPEFEPDTGLMMKESCVAQINRMLDFATSNPINVVVCWIEYPQLIVSSEEKFTEKVSLVRFVVRKTDVLARFGQRAMLVFLMDCMSSDAFAAASRIKNAITDDSPDVMFGYACLEEHRNETDLIAALAKQIELAKGV